MTTKTPISILNEYMFKFGQTPQYQLLQDSAGHDTIFKYVVTAGSVQETGCGRSKKEAKHKAAEKALATLANSDSVVRAQLLLTSGIATEKAAAVATSGGSGSVAVSPYAEQVTENSVGALTELCAVNHLDEPVYEMTGDTGPAHSKTFTILCKVLTLKEQGVARTKKQAKQISAKRMIDTINDHLAMASSKLLSSSQKKVAKEKLVEKSHRNAIDGYCSIKDKDRGNAPGKNVSQTLSTCHLALRQIYGGQLSTLREFALGHSAKETLSMFVDNHEITLAYYFLKTKKEGNFVCAATLETTPELVACGEGPDVTIAEDVASINLLKALIIMMTNSSEEE